MLIAVVKNSLHTVVSCHVKEISSSRLALHQVLAGKLCFTFIYT